MIGLTLMQRKFYELVMSVVLLLGVFVLSKIDINDTKIHKNTLSNNITSVSEGSKKISESSNVLVGNTDIQNSKKYVVVIDPGHGGIDSGKVAINGKYEKEINLAISKFLKEYLENNNIEVYLTREDDNGLYKENDKNKKSSDMKKRCAIIDTKNANVAVSIHQNSFTDDSVKGAQVFFYTHSAQGKALASIIQQSIKDNVDKDNTRTEKSNDSYYILINTSCPTVIVECGFLSNDEEAQLLSSKDYQMIMAKAIGDGIIDYLQNVN